MKNSWENYKIQHSGTIHLKLEDGNTMAEMVEEAYQEIWWVSGIRIWVKCRNTSYAKENSIGGEQFMVEGEWDDEKNNDIYFNLNKM